MSGWALGLLATLPALAAFALGGWALDRGLALDASPDPLARWALRVALALAALFLLALHPLALALPLAALVVRRVRGASAVSSRERVDRVSLACLGVLVGIAAVRAPTPVYWDEFVWLWKARVALGGWGALRAASLDPGSEIYPPGYPLLWPLAAAWFRGGALTLAAWVPLALALALWVSAVRAAVGKGAAGAVVVGAGLLAVTPLVVVHLRASYVDLPVGLLASALALGEWAARGEGGKGWASVAARAGVAVLLVGLKDEGLVHLVAVSAGFAGHALVARRPRLAFDTGAILLAGAVPFVAWRALLARYGVSDTHHELGACALGEAVPLVRAFGVHAADVTSWGVLWPVVGGAGLAAVVTRGESLRAARALAVALGAQAGGILLGLTCGTERVREFAFGGSLVNRALMQLVPQAVALVALVVAGSARKSSE